MARWINRVTLLGNVGADPEVHNTSLGGKVATFSLATTERWQAEGQQQEKTQWHHCQAWNGKNGGQQLADTVTQYVHKGDRLLIEGSIAYRQFTKEDGSKGYATDIRVRELTLLTPRADRAAD